MGGRSLKMSCGLRPRLQVAVLRVCSPRVPLFREKLRRIATSAAAVQRLRLRCRQEIFKSTRNISFPYKMNAVVIFFEKNKEVPGSYSTQNQRVRPASIMSVDSNTRKNMVQICQNFARLELTFGSLQAKSPLAQLDS